MACNLHNTTIDDVKYVTVSFPARTGAKISVRIIKTFGSVFTKVGKSIEETEIDIAGFLEKLDDDKVIDLIIELLTYTKRNGKDIDFDIDFAEEYLHLLKVCVWVISVNGFFGKGDILSTLANLIKKTKEKETTTTTQESPTN
jgi:hypothetical protein